MSLSDLYRVDTVPWWLRPFFFVYAYALGLPLLAYVTLVHRTMRLEITRQPGADENQSTVFCSWHETIWLLFITNRARLPEFTILSHPAWYMEPIYVMLRGFGIRRFILGSSGHYGRQAAERLVETVRQKGGFVGINPDGPSGPPHVLKKGALHIALQTGLPITPLRYECRGKLRSPSWDRKWIPLPFARVRMHVGTPIIVTEANLAELVRELPRQL